MINHLGKSKRTIDSIWKASWIKDSRSEQDNKFLPYIWGRKWYKKKLYNGEFDPGSWWNLATGLTQASRGAAYW